MSNAATAPGQRARISRMAATSSRSPTTRSRATTATGRASRPPGRSRRQRSNPNSAAVKGWRAAPDQQARRRAGQGRRDQDLRLHRHEQRRRRRPQRRARPPQLAKTPGVVRAREGPAAHSSTRPYSPTSSASTRRAASGRSSAARPHAGAGIVVGVIDTGIWPENPSFAGGTGIPVPATGTASAWPGSNFPASTCNDKLIGARYYVAGFGKKNIAKDEFLSPRDGSGHGSHTSSTAAGNYGVTDDHRRQHDRHRLGHGAGREDRDVQGLLGGQAGHPGRLLQLRQRRRDQRRGRSTASTS